MNKSERETSGKYYSFNHRVNASGDSYQVLPELFVMNLKRIPDVIPVLAQWSGALLRVSMRGNYQENPILNRANFQGAVLCGANLKGMNLGNADLKGTNGFDQSNLDLACGNEITALPERLTIKGCP